MFIICTVQIVWIKPEIQPILLNIPFSSGRFHACRLKIERGKGGGKAVLGSTTYRVGQSFAFGRGGVYGLDLAPGRKYVEKIRNFVNKKKKQ